MEPNLQCTAALLSPATGIVDSHSYMLALQGDAESSGAMLAFHSPVTKGRVNGAGHRARGRRNGADEASLPAGGQFRRPARPDPRAKDRGHAIRPHPDGVLRQRKLFHLGRPLALLAPDLSRPGAGRARRAHHRRSRRPGASSARTSNGSPGIDYTVDPHRSDKFYAAVRKYWPALKDGALQPGYAGIRPKIVPPGAPAQDFTIQGPAEHGVPGLINLFGIELPGLTASLALAERVSALAAA